MQGGADYIVLKNLDIDSIRIIGSVLGQSIALDYFVSQVIFLEIWENSHNNNFLSCVVEKKGQGIKLILVS